ncbi:hypothetical protein EII31_06845 [Leucobacter sp. OH2974_COT-288]|uniref:ABC-type nickel/cobalt efflux system permease component RcnA n=1 Tax=Canibacter oris TaxID=1365628 RepID=A0A840DJ46_9MICO|nr:hypothetical protein [Canibacter oris]MBB4071775.1 ABC-type nickel/cobalt efflux system permease component RcnA [Canibacter oris]RRD35117.1 hypothetical protein EII31_06845 [Leucobacter sp. OH2974_COT-288]
MTERQEIKREETVRVERTVKINRLLLLGAGLGAVLAVLITVLFPVVPEGFYTLGQIAGFMAIIGAALGLLAGALLALVLTRLAKKRSGTATAVRAEVK